MKSKKLLQSKFKKFIKSVKDTDKYLLFIIVSWIFLGFFIFISASLGLLARDTELMPKVLSKQAIYLFISFALLLFVSQINFKSWLRASPFLFIFSLIATTLVLIPKISFSSGGATRWLLLGPFSVQPAEFLKAFSALFAIKLWLSLKDKKFSFKTLLAFFAPFVFIAVILLKQPDTSNTILIAISFGLVYFLFGAPWKQIAALSVLSVLALALLFTFKPYVKQRFLVFLHPEKDPLGAGYQINQSLIAVGSGHIFGKGFGQGVQKFGYLPEPVGDSIFANYAEEFGFAGSLLLIFILILFLLRTTRIAKRSKNKVASVAILSISLTIIFQAIMNIGSMIAIFPLTGVTFPFLSLGGSSLLASAIMLGLILSAAKYSHKAR